MNILAVISLAFGLLISFMNWYTIVQSSKSKKFVSSVPLIGAATLWWGLSSFEQTRSYAWTAVIIDYGTLMLIFGILYMFYDSFMTSFLMRLDRFVVNK